MTSRSQSGEFTADDDTYRTMNTEDPLDSLTLSPSDLSLDDKPKPVAKSSWVSWF